MAIREGRWDCQYCGTVGVLGRHKSCPVCASARPEGTKFYLPADAEVVTDDELLGYAQIGPDWICAFCSSSNGADRHDCHSCGASREATSEQQKVTTYGLDEVPRSGDMDFSEPAPRPTSKATTNATANRTWMWIAGGVVAFLLLCCGLPLLFSGAFSNDNQTVTVDQYSWERAVEVEDFRTVTEEDWTLPAAGRVLAQEERIHHYEEVLERYETRTREVSEQVQVGTNEYVCGQRDLGNGFFEDVMCSDPVYETRYRTESYEEPIYRDEPVYQTFYTYEIDKWIVDRTLSEAGLHAEPFWPNVTLAEGEREGERTESYSIVFVSTDDGETYTLEFPYSEWISYEPGVEYTLITDFLGQPVSVEQPE